uniref:Nuclear nucleic acid-binding protein C1D n=1 Tax=Caenorhabditis tropicalis TaxID=1561998 RepID=A0A1I7UGB7_9PELO
MSESKSVPPELIAKLQKFDQIISKLEDAVEEIDVGVDKHFERTAHEMALVDSMSMFLMDTLLWTVQATKGGGADKNEELLIDMARTKRITNDMKEINLRQDAPRINKTAASNFVRNALWEAKDQGGDEKEAEKSKKPESS